MENIKNNIQICRVYSPPKVKKGVWILVDKLWPRGLKKEALDFDLWLKEITPSTPLRTWFHEEPEKRWHQFVHNYAEELQNKHSLIEDIQSMAKHQPVTLFYAAKNTEHNHAVILQEAIRSWPDPLDETLFGDKQ